MRIDDQKPNAAEQANRDDRNRQNLRQKESVSGNQAAQQAGYKQTRDFQSLFDQALEKSRIATQKTQAEEAKFDSKIKDILSSDDKGRNRDKSDAKKDKDEDKKLKSSEEKNSGKAQKEGGIKDKILGKSNSGGQGSGGGSFSDSKGDSSGQFGGRQKGQGAQLRSDLLAPTAFQNQQIQSVQSASLLQNVQNLQKIPPQVLDNIVQYIRVGLNKNLDKEIHLDLSDKIFKGLSLRVALSSGKLQVTFVTHHADVRRVFEASTNDIRQALQGKGHVVDFVKIQS